MLVSLIYKAMKYFSKCNNKELVVSLPNFRLKKFRVQLVNKKGVVTTPADTNLRQGAYPLKQKDYKMYVNK